MIRIRITVERYPFKLWLAYHLLKAARSLNVDIEARWPHRVWREEKRRRLPDDEYLDQLFDLARSDETKEDPLVQRLVALGW